MNEPEHDKENDYHLGTSEEELHRLGYQHQVWQDVTCGLWRDAGFSRGMTLLDLGCGPGFATTELARLVGPEGRVEAVDAAETFLLPLQKSLEAAHLTQVRVQRGDAHSIPLEDNSVDGVFVRWLMCFVANPAMVFQEIHRVLKPGGRAVIWDYYNYLSVNVFPERPAISRLFRAYHESALKHGGSYDIGQRLPALAISSGLEIHQLVPINRVAQPGSVTWQWVSMFHQSYLPKLLESGLMNEIEVQDFRKAWQEAESDPASFFFSPPMLGLIACKPT